MMKLVLNMDIFSPFLFQDQLATTAMVPFWLKNFLFVSNEADDFVVPEQ